MIGGPFNSMQKNPMNNHYDTIPVTLLRQHVNLAIWWSEGMFQVLQISAQNIHTGFLLFVHTSKIVVFRGGSLYFGSRFVLLFYFCILRQSHFHGAQGMAVVPSGDHVRSP